MNYFALLELPVTFAVDEAALHRAYIGKQREFHPDRMARAPQAERAQAMHVSVEVNQAYHTLKDRLRRADYLLRLMGGEESKPSQALLMESLEAREALMEAQTPQALAGQEAYCRAEIEAAFARIAEDFASNRLNAAAECAMRLRYLHKLWEEIQARSKLLAAGKDKA